jgi:hypothetical protein
MTTRWKRRHSCNYDLSAKFAGGTARVFTHYLLTISFNKGSSLVKTIKTLTFAAVAGLTLAVVPAMAQSTSSSTTTRSTDSGTTMAVPGTVNNNTSQLQVPNPTEHRDATGQTHGTSSSAAGGGK